MNTKHHVLKSLKIAILALIAIPFMAAQMATAADTAPEGDNAVMCAKCKTVWVSRPVTAGVGKGGPGIVIYREEKAMKCDDCESAVATFFKTGKLNHECKACGSELTHCKAH